MQLQLKQFQVWMDRRRMVRAYTSSEEEKRSCAAAAVSYFLLAFDLDTLPYSFPFI